MAKIIGRIKKRSRKHYKKEEKAGVIAQLLSPGCTVAEVAKSTGISRTTLHEWRRGALFAKSSAHSGSGISLPQESLAGLPVNPSASFVEVAVSDGDKAINQSESCEANCACAMFNMDTNTNANLSEVSLTFGDFSLNIKGRFSSSRLMAMLDLLGR